MAHDGMSEQDLETLRHQLAQQEDRLARIESARVEILRRIARIRAKMLAIEQELLEAPASAEPLSKKTPSRATITVSSSAADKIALFRSLFRGRDDVFAKRWSNQHKGTRGYSPACANEWASGLCTKPRTKCGQCPNQAFLPITDQVIRDHLQGRHTVGVYPLLSDETCWLLAIDFDKEHWQRDVTAFRETCQGVGLPVSLERSRSGQGAHVWFFFQRPVAAALARTMGCYLLSEAMTRHPELSMRSFDRLFPNQDTLPKGGFGNLIAIPLQARPREAGNTLFIDEDMRPYQDQWAYLSSVQRLTPGAVRELAHKAQGTGGVLGLTLPPAEEIDLDDGSTALTRESQPLSPDIKKALPASIKITLASQICIPKAGLPAPLITGIKRLAAFQNPEFFKRQRMRLSTALTPRVIHCAEDTPEQILLPRGCLEDVRGFLTELGVALEVVDRRSEGEPLDVRFHGDLTDLQADATESILDHEDGVLVAPPGSGKTVAGIQLIARRGRNTLVLVHRSHLLEQWVAQLAIFLDLPQKEIGRIGAGRHVANGRLDVAMVQSLARRKEAEETLANYGHVVVDECHHIPASSFERVIRRVSARYVTGLTATPRRRDGHDPILRFHLGPERFSRGSRHGVGQGLLEHRLVVRETAFHTTEETAARGIQAIYGELATDEARNTMILDDVIQALEDGRCPILLTERRDHLEFFEAKLRGVVRNLIVLHGGMKASERQAAARCLAGIGVGEERLVVATGRCIGEGFDHAQLDTLFLAMPVSWKGILVQYAGRLHRHYPGKTEIRIVDYVDRRVPMLARMFDKRLRGYRAMGYTEGRQAMLG